ncbi:MAG: transposase [Deltaproteobacteria bacterium]|nr:transposase [Deltaproteobacteria bacterium]
MRNWREDRGGPFRYPEPGRTVLDGIRSRIRLPRPGWLKHRNSRPVEGALRNFAAPIETDGSRVPIQTERDVPDPAPSRGDAVGLDMGIVRFAAGSDGTFPALPPGAPAETGRLLERKRSIRKVAAGKFRSAKESR